MLEHVQTAIDRAEKLQSKITPEAEAVPAFASPKIRHLLNNLGTAPGLHYLEIGVHKGGTFVSANYGNQLASSVAVDNWSEFGQDGVSKQEFINHTRRLLRPGSYTFLEMDCFDMTAKDLPNPVNFYLYDGNHSRDAQKQALTHFYPMLDETFIFLVDDYSWDDVRLGTQDGIQELNLDVLFERSLYDGWWNGFYVSVLRKRK